MRKIIETKEACPSNLATVLGFMLDSWSLSSLQEARFIESVLVLSYAAGLHRDHAVRPFAEHQVLANEIWDALQHGQIPCTNHATTS